MAVQKTNKVVGAGASKASAKGHSFFIDFSGPASDGVLDGDAFEKFLHDRIKVDGKAGQLSDAVIISREGEGKIWVKTTIPFSKRYLKYLTKKFLKRAELRDWLRVVATSKPGFEIKYVHVCELTDTGSSTSRMTRRTRKRLTRSKQPLSLHYFACSQVAPQKSEQPRVIQCASKHCTLYVYREYPLGIRRL